MSITVTKEVEFFQEVDIEVDLDDIEDDALIQEVIDRGISLEEIDAIADSWEFTRRMRDYFVAEMAKVEAPV